MKLRRINGDTQAVKLQPLLEAEYSLNHRLRHILVPCYGTLVPL